MIDPRIDELEQQVEQLAARLRLAQEEVYSAKQDKLTAEERAKELSLDLIRTQNEAKEHLLESENLLDGLRGLTEALDVEQIFKGMLEVLQRVLVFEHAFVVASRDQGQFKIVAATDTLFAGSVWQPQRYFNRVLAGKILTTFNTGQISEWQAQPSELRETAVSALHMPIGTGNTQAILICTHSQRGFFTKKETVLASRFSVFAINALQNAELYRTLKEERDTLEDRVRKRTEEIQALAKFPAENPAPIIRVFADGDIHYANQAGINLLSTLPEQNEKELPDKWLKIIHHTLRTNKIVRNEHQIGRRIFYCTFVPIVNANYVNIYGQDVTERKRAEFKLKKARILAEQATHAKAAFLASMSHEIRTPLNSVIGLTGLLLDTKLDEKQRNFLAIVRGSGRTLLSIINNILDYSKLEAGKMELETQPFALSRFLRETLDLLQNEASRKELKLEYEILPSVPEVIKGDSTRLRQILINLLSNGIKFTEQGSVSIIIDGRETENNYCELHFSIKDTGIGIPSDQMSQLFQSFSQVDASTTRKYGGTGLGLAICKQLVAIMNGDIWVESELGQGSTFHFTVQIESSLPRDLPQTSPLFVIDQQLGVTSPLRILLVEDDLVNQQVAVYMLEKIGYRADVAANGLEALDALRRQPYDVLFMDIQMPEMDGITATQVIKKEYSSGNWPYIIAMTANALEGDRERFLAIGMDDYVSKPILIEELTAALHRAAPSVSYKEQKAPVSDIAVKTVSTMSTTPIDTTVFKERLGLKNLELLMQMLDLFLQEAATQLTRLQQAIADNDYENIQRAAHHLRGSGSNVAALQFSAICHDIEMMGKQKGSFEERTKLFAQLEQEHDRIISWKEMRG